MLLKLNEKAVDALSDRNQHLLDRDQALEKMQQVQAFVRPTSTALFLVHGSSNGMLL
jgi:hypothetical protein